MPALRVAEPHRGPNIVVIATTFTLVSKDVDAKIKEGRFLLLQLH